MAAMDGTLMCHWREISGRGQQGCKLDWRQCGGSILVERKEENKR